MVFMSLLTFPLQTLAIGFDAEEAYNSVVVIYSVNSVGSGFAIGENCIITNAHVIENSRNITVANYKGERFSAAVFAIDEVMDIAVLSVEGATFPPFSSSDYALQKIGDDVYTIGAPNSMTYSLTKGVLSAKDRNIGRYKYIQFDAAINSGNSGGPLLNDNGDVIGVNTLKISDAEGIGLAIPMTVVNEFLKNNGIEVNEQGYIEKPIMPNKTADIIENPTENTGEANRTNFFDTNLLLLISLSASGLLNVVLIIILFYKRHKTVKVKTDASDRTDFDIDILG